MNKKGLIQFCIGILLIVIILLLAPRFVTLLSQNEVVAFVVEKEIDTSTLFYTEDEYRED